MKQTEWSIVYTNYDGIIKRAVNLLSKEVGANIIREPNVYKIYVLPCVKEGQKILKNAFFVGCYSDSPTIQKYVSFDELPDNGYLVKVIANPDDANGRYIILTGKTEQDVFYSVVSFIDDYIPKYAPFSGANCMPDLIFDFPLKECAYTGTFDNNVRSIFTWGHSINDYRLYIDNMARLKFNELILWNDFIPLNINEIIDYAHSYGIKVILGYSWGWKEIGNKSAEISLESIEQVKQIAIKEYRDNYAPIGCDGIYFQSFTERKEERIGGMLISELVVQMVNDVADAIWKTTPSLRLIFGLHATSVRNRLNDIAKIDPRMDILWEDCGDFPYYYDSYVKNEQDYIDTIEFVKKLLKLRNGVGVGLVFKGVMMLDWSKFVFQTGPYVLGENSNAIKKHDRMVRSKSWKEYSADWIRNGDRALEMLRVIKDNKLGEINMCLAGTFDGEIYLPMALCAQMYQNCDMPYKDILQQVMRRPSVKTN